MRCMRTIRRLLVLGAAGLLVFVGAPAASAGGPTSVIIVNPVTGATGSLYTSDADYASLESALQPRSAQTEGGTEPSTWLRGGPGTSAINVTWLIHDVSVWRVNRVLLDADDGPWVQTVEMDMSSESALDWDQAGEWGRSANPERLLAVFDRLGVLTNSADETFAHSWAAEKPQQANAADPGPSFRWWWTVVGVIAGISLGALGGPRIGAWLRDRDRGPRQQLVDG